MTYSSADLYQSYLHDNAVTNATVATVGAMTVGDYYKQLLRNATDATFYLDGQKVSGVRSRLLALGAQVPALERHTPNLRAYWQVAGIDPLQRLSLAAFTSALEGVAQPDAGLALAATVQAPGQTEFIDLGSSGASSGNINATLAMRPLQLGNSGILPPAVSASSDEEGHDFLPPPPVFATKTNGSAKIPTSVFAPTPFQQFTECFLFCMKLLEPELSPKAKYGGW